MKPWLLVIIILSVFLIEGCSQTVLEKEQDYEQARKKELAKHEDALADAIEKGTVEACGKLESQYFQDRCMHKNSVIEKNPLLCRQIDDGQIQDFCFSDLAEVFQDVVWCEEIEHTNRASTCIMGVAIATKNHSLCALSKGYAPNCYSRLFRNNTDSALCESIDDDDGFEMTGSTIRSNCYFSLASRLQNSKLCDKIDHGASRDGCFRQLATLSEDGILCEKVEGDGDRTFCLIDIAKKTKNPMICALAGEKESHCYADVFHANDDPALCEKVIVDPWKGNCFVNLARNLGDASWCSQASELAKPGCLKSVEERKALTEQ